MNPKEELLGISRDFEQVVDPDTDTTIYSFQKMLKLLSNCNPNTIEILGLRPEDYLIVTAAGRKLLEEGEIFLSKKAIYTFGNYAKSQLNRLINRSGRAADHLVENEKRSLSKVCTNLENRYPGLKVDLSEDEDIRINWATGSAIPIEQVTAILNELNTVHKDYKKSVRNDKATTHGKLCKHAMHLIRLYMMGIEILGKQEIKTYRDGADHDFLMDIRSGKYMEADGITPTKEFEALVSDYQAKFEEAAKKTTLPDLPDIRKINDLAIRINKMFF